jgi:hypothetical protein
LSGKALRQPADDDTPTALGPLPVDEEKLRGHVDEVVRSSVEETLNGLVDVSGRISSTGASMA